MTKVNFEENFEIYLFNGQDTDASSSKLNEFLAFLKFHKVSLPYKFSFVSREASLIPEMTLNQNILMDFSPNSLTESKDVQFQEFLKDPKNKSLENLYNTIALPHALPSQSDAQMKKVCSLIKSLLCEGQFIFLEEPEVDLGPATAKLFISALKDHVSVSERNVFVYSRSLPIWVPHAHKTVERLPNYSFLVSPVGRSMEWEKERAAFYNSATPQDNEGVLKFTHPQKIRKNNAA